MNGEDGIALATDSQPDIILLDVEMPGLNGYEVCDQLRQTNQFENTPIVFLSSHCSLRERLQGYESGGTDYLTKPFEPDTLRAKIRVLDDTLSQQNQLRDQAIEAQKTAYSALSTSSELGQVVHLAEQIAMYNSICAVGEAIVKSATSMQLSVVVSIRGYDDEYWYSAGVVTPLEKEVMSLLREEQRINDFGARTVVNYPYVSMMVKNMPLSDMERYGRIKDIVPAILSTANGKIEALNSTFALKNQTTDITKTLKNAHRVLSSLISEGRDYRVQVDERLSEMFNNLQGKIPYMGLDEDQEIYIVKTIDDSILEVREIEDKAEVVNTNIDSVLVDIDNLVERQKSIIEKVNATLSDDSDDSDDFQGVELF